MLAGLMQTMPLQISGIIRFAAKAHGDREIVSRLVDEPTHRYVWADCERRARKAAQALQRIGILSRDRVTSLAWNTHRHLELFCAVPGIGAVLHTANLRMSDDQIVYTINHAGSLVLVYNRQLFANPAVRLTVKERQQSPTSRPSGQTAAVDPTHVVPYSAGSVSLRRYRSLRAQ